MEQVKPPSSRLFISNVIEGREDVDENSFESTVKYHRFEKSYVTLQGLISGLSEKEAHDALTSSVCKSQQSHEEVSLGLLTTILTETENAARAYRDLTLVSRDGLAFIITQINTLVLEKFSRLLDSARGQLLWLFREFVKNNVTGTDGLCWNLLRQVAGGDVTPRNLWLSGRLVEVLEENRAWLDKLPFLIASTVYTYLRLLEDHCGPTYEKLRQKEVTFTVTLIRDKFTDCLVIGRDFVRLLQNIARIPEFESLWRDMLFNPSSLSTNFTGIVQLLQTRTSRRFLQSRLTPDMERKLVFLTSQVRFGNQKRYQEWFQRQYLAAAESQSLRCDLIRFIVGVIHPTNELLCSDIIPRWAVIGWLLTTCTSNIAASNAKLALFYDWLMFDGDKDNIMNIEPAILVMHHSMRSHPAITATLLDFLCRIIPNFFPPFSERVKSGVHMALRHILKKRVLPSLSPLFDNTRLDKELRASVRDHFKEFITVNESGGVGHEVLPSEVRGLDGTSSPMKLDNHEEAVFSDSDDSDDVTELKIDVASSVTDSATTNHLQPKLSPLLNTVNKIKEEFNFAPVKIESSSSEDSGDSTSVSPDPELEHLDFLDDNVRVIVLKIYHQKDNEQRCGSMDDLVGVLIREHIDGETATALSTCLCGVLENDFQIKLYPHKPNDESIEDSIGRPLFVLFRELCHVCDDPASRRPLLNLLAEMHKSQDKLGYHLLYYLSVSKSVSKMSEGKMRVYKDFCKEVCKDLSTCLVNDMQRCQDEEMDLFLFLLPVVYSAYPTGAIGNSSLLHLLVSSIDSSQLHKLTCLIFTGAFIMFRKEYFLGTLSTSLSWETYEQVCVWQLVLAHSIPVDYILPLIPKLQYPQHGEALSGVLIILLQEKASVELVRCLMGREVSSADLLVVSCLNHWSHDDDEQLSDIVGNLMLKYSSPQALKRKRNVKGQPGATEALERMMGHLDMFRSTCKQQALLNQDIIQQGLQQIQTVFTDTQKRKFSELFALFEESDVKSRGGRHKKSSHKTPKKIINNVSDSTTTTSDTEEDIAPKPRFSSKKRKKGNPVNSDSD